MSFLPYIKIARFDHWFKNVFVLPGVVVAIYLQPGLADFDLLLNLILVLLVTGFVASSNYVINEVLDADKDALHPVKKNRPVPSGEVNIPLAYGLWILLAVVGLGLAWTMGTTIFLIALWLWVMGCIYNIPPIRSKDKPYIDVLSEAINNPIRLLLGWYCTGTELAPPLSLIIAYWMVGAFFMAVKRFAEFRKIDDPERAAAYRQSFGHYTEERLLVSVIYYAVTFGLFFGIFLLRYRMELIVSIPLIAGFIAWYIHLGFLEDSPAQYPEKLYLQRGFVLYAVVCMFSMMALLFVDIPVLGEFFASSIAVQ